MKKVCDFGTGEYPNNVCNYLLGQNLLLHVEIPESGDKLQRLWKDIMRNIPQYMAETIEYVFEEKFTYKETGKARNVSASTVRTDLRRIYNAVRADGYLLQPLWAWAYSKGYVKELQQEDVNYAREHFGFEDEISELQAFVMYEGLKSGMKMQALAKRMGCKIALVNRFYQACVRAGKMRWEKEV